MSEPADPVLYEKVKKKIKKTFKAYPSAYASGAIVKEYKRLGGRYKKSSKKSSGLKRWFREKWIDVCKYPKIVPCGRRTGGYKTPYPMCRPLYRVSKKTPVTVKEISKSERKSRCKLKRKKPYNRVYVKKKTTR